MSSNTPSNDDSPRLDRRVTFHRSTYYRSSLTEKDNHGPTPLEAALDLSQKYIATLHSGVTTFLTELVERCLKEYAEFFYSNEKSQGMSLGTAQVPASVKKIKLTLQPLEEVKESEDYKALHTQLVAETEALHRNWVEKYTKVVNAWNCNARLCRFRKSVCVLLRSAAIAFIAQLGLQNNPEDEIVMNLFATSGVNILTTSPPMDLTTILRLYKEVNGLTNLPTPTVQGVTPNINTIITEINQGASTIATANMAPAILFDSTPTASADPPNLQTALPSNTMREPTSPHVETPLLATRSNVPTDTPRIEVTTPQNVITPSILGQSVLNDTIATATTSLPLERVPILYNGEPTGYTRLIAPTTVTTPAPTLQQRETLPGNPPIFSVNQQPVNDNTSHTQDSIDISLANINLEEITIHAEKQKIQTMLYNLVINGIKKPIIEFNACVTHRVELNRIKAATTSLPMESLAAKVTAKIHAELTVDRPVLRGLIRDESDKATGKVIEDLKRKLQSVSDKFESNDRKLNELKKSRGEDSMPKRQRRTKNGRGGSLTWSRNNSAAAAVNSSTSNHKQTHQRTNDREKNGSHAANNNASAARRRKKNKNRSNN
jgi:hypothetical protein